jgi:hypothetical protein
MRRLIAAAAAIALPGPVLAGSVVAAAALTATAASAETVAATTSCSNPFTGAQPGPSSFTFTVPTTIHPGDSVPIQLSFAVANNSGFDITDINTFSMPGALPVALTAGSQGAVANGSSATVTLTGTWSPTATGTQAITAANWTFDTVALGLTIPVTCTFTSAPPSVTRTVTPRPTLTLATAATRPGRSVHVSGMNWTPSTSGTLSLCDSARACTVIGAARADAAGRLCGAGWIPAGTVAGSYDIQVALGPDTETAPLVVLRARPAHHRHHRHRPSRR